jgi:hypothetical protein
MNILNKSVDIVEQIATNYKNPLIIESTKQMGDALHNSIIVRHYRKMYPTRDIIWLVSERYIDPFKYYKYATSIVGLPHELTLDDRRELCKTLRAKFEVLAPCVGVSGEHTFGSIANQFFYNAKIKSLMVPRRPVLPLGEEDTQFAQEFRRIHTLKRFICLEYNSFSFERKVKGGIWPLEYYQEFLDRVKAPVVWLAHNDAPAFKHGIDGRNTTWRQAAALIKSSNLFIGCGSGLTMVASTEGIETPILEVNIGPTITMKGCGYKNSTDLHKQTPTTLLASIKQFKF